MKNRFCRMGKQLLGVACLLSTCGVTYSCSDDYDLDETKPSFLGQSIYDELNARGNFKTVIRLIDDLGYKDVMQKQVVKPCLWQTMNLIISSSQVTVGA